MTYLIVLIILGLAGGAVYVVRSMSNRGTNVVGARLDRYGIATAGGGAIGGVSQLIGPSTMPRTGDFREEVNRRVIRSRFGSGIAQRLREADLKITPGEYVILSVTFVAVMCLIGLLLRGVLGFGLMLIVTPFIPRLYLRRRIGRRRRDFLEQLADVSQMMGNSMRAGFSILQAMEVVGTEAKQPARDEFERVVTEVKLGLSIDAALEHLLERMPSEDLNLMIVAINVQRQVGGNLADILMIIAKTVRERVRFARDLKTLTAQARYSSYIITGLPICVAIAINILDRPYESYLYTHLGGEIMVVIALCMLGLGFFFLRKIANIEV